MTLFVGIDVGTSGVRCAAVDRQGRLAGASRVEGAAPPLADGVDAAAWWHLAREALAALAREVPMGEVGAISSGGTSGSMVALDAAGAVAGPGYMYDSAGFDAEAAELGASPASATARALHALRAGRGAVHLAHQADLVLHRLGAPAGITDENNALKTGYDPEARAWPAALRGHPELGPALPRVVPVAAPVGRVGAEGRALGLPEGCRIRAGTTDSIAAFMATGARAPGDAVTSLGTTLAIKLVSPARIEDATRGVYSHRLGDRWLAGGASNVGGGVLARLFGAEALKRLSARIDPAVPSPLDYYPLNRTGERFPVADPAMEPRLEPRPEDDAAYLHGLLEGVARVEAQGYGALEALGAPAPASVVTVGGGARSAVWTAIRARVLGLPVSAADEVEGSVGLARWIARMG